MGKLASLSIFLLRISMGWLFLYSGVVKVFDSTWSAAAYLAGASTFPKLFAFFADPVILPYVNFLNKWGLLAIGLSLILGLFVRWSSLAGIVLMALYYFAKFQFPYAGEGFFIVDSHVIYALVFFFFITFSAGRIWGLDRRLDF